MAETSDAGSGKNQKSIIMLLSGTTIALLIATIVLAVQKSSGSTGSAAVESLSNVTSGSTGSAAVEMSLSNVPDNKMFDIESIFMSADDNTCLDVANKNLKFENVDCVHVPGPQAAANVTKGYQGGLEVDFAPNLDKYWQSKMCPVNVHWHLGAEHYSVGQYDENGEGPNGGRGLEPASEDHDSFHDGHSINETKADDTRRELASGGDYDDHEIRGGFRCHHFDAADEKHTKPYEWKHCKDMEVGETYEVHWPHSAAGACGTVNQYQTPFYDGVFCNIPDLATFQTLDAQSIASAVGVQGQVFSIVNDESYFYPDLIRGWVVDKVDDMGQDIAYYTGSTTGTTRNNEVCSAYAPITWQVDRKCHMISASSFDKLCYDMKMQRDDMSDDLHAHGARELVKDSLVANNMQRKLVRDHEHEHDHEHVHEHDHEHDHDHVHSHKEHESNTGGGHLTDDQAHHLHTYGHYHEKAVSQEWY